MSSYAVRLAFSLCFACSAPASSTTAESTTPEFTEAKVVTPPPPMKEYRHSPILNGIMKNEINKPFSKLTFFVFHSEGEFDFKEIEKSTSELSAGVSKARAFPDPPVESQQGREVFATFLENLDRDCGRLTSAVAARDPREMRVMLGKLSKTCNNCNHFFRLDIADSPEQ